MATLSKLVEDGVLGLVEVELDGDAQPWRCVYAVDKFGQWLTNGLPNLPRIIDAQLTPAQQVDDLLAIFVGGEPLFIPKMFRPLRPVADCVWELKTPDVRLLGWFPRKDIFIGARGGDASFIKDHDLYHGLIGEVVRVRDKLDLDPPKYLTGVNADDVISNRP
jgi:hypothetical protein